MDIYDDIQINDPKTIHNIDEWKYKTEKQKTIHDKETVNILHRRSF